MAGIRAPTFVWLAVACFLLSTPGALAPGPARVASDRLPTLAPVAAALLDNDVVRDPSTGRYLLRFTNTIGNYGDGRVQVVAYGAGSDPDDPLATVLHAYQRVYRTDGTYHDERVGDVKYHTAHHHFHFLGAARYRLMDESTAVPTVLAESFAPFLAPCNDDQYLGDLTDPLAVLLGWDCISASKVSFCLADVGIVSDRSRFFSHVPKYNACEHNQNADWIQMGISVGWGDTYDRHLVGQAFDVTELMDRPPQWYTLEATTNPDGLLWETNRGDPASAHIEVYLGQGVPTGVGKSRPGV
ncbi:MAG: hypothetical protein ACT4PT_11850 [Methanobacteriota archaeon]